jgi:hypothetical protein
MRSIDVARACCLILSLSLVTHGCSSSDAGGTSGGTCTGGAVDKTCGGAACGGDVTGKWTLVGSCFPSCVKSVYTTVTYGADGSYNGSQGTWKTSGTTLSTTVGGATGSFAYCVTGDRLWLNWGTRCTATGTDPITVVYQRDCGGAAPGPTATR